MSLQHSPPDRLELTVADDGIGISEEQMKPGSAGTGLNLVRMLVRQLGASLKVDHSPGTAFHIAFKDAAGSAGKENTKV